MTVEASADDRAVLRPPVTGIGGGVDRAHGQTARAQPFDDRRPLLGVPRRLADGEERERPRGANVVDRYAAHVVDATAGEPVHLGDLVHADRGLVEHAVDARGTVGVRARPA